MADHEFPDDDFSDGSFGGGHVEVQRVQPYQAVKEYRCPGCDHEIRVGEGHVVVVPVGAAEERRHWHHSCWGRKERGSRGPIRRR